MKKFFLILLLFGFVSTPLLESCNKTNYIDAYVVKDGDPNVDGCGWLLNISGSLFYPVGLRDEHKVDGKLIQIQYTVSAVPHKCINNIEYPVASITKYL